MDEKILELTYEGGYKLWYSTPDGTVEKEIDSTNFVDEMLFAMRDIAVAAWGESSACNVDCMIKDLG